MLMRELCDAAELACQDLTSHMEREELQVRGQGCHTHQISCRKQLAIPALG